MGCGHGKGMVRVCGDGESCEDLILCIQIKIPQFYSHFADIVNHMIIEQAGNRLYN